MFVCHQIDLYRVIIFFFLNDFVATPRITGVPLTEHTFLFCGAGEAGTGIGQMIVIALMKLGLTSEEAHKRCWFVDSRYLLPFFSFLNNFGCNYIFSFLCVSYLFLEMS